MQPDLPAIHAVLRRCTLALTVVAALGLVACDPPKILEMRVRDGQLERVLRSPSRTRTTSTAELSPLAGEERVVRSAPPPPEEEPPVRGRYRGALPDDLGGSGVFLVRSTSLGATYHYQERTPGSDTPAAVARRIDAFATTAARIVRACLAKRLQDHPARAALERLAVDRLIPDLRELAWYAWLWTSEIREFEEVALRVGQYLLDRGYVEFTLFENGPLAVSELQLRELWRAFVVEALNSDGVVLSEAEQRELAFILDVDEAVIWQLVGEALWTEDLVRSWLQSRYPDATSTEQARLARVMLAFELPQPDAGAPAERSEADTLLSAFFDDQVRDVTDLLKDLGLDWQSRSVEASLEISAAPIATNGSWDAEAGHVRWTQGLPRAGSLALPGFMYATWAERNDARQAAIFGRTVLDGSSLGSYVEELLKLSLDDRGTWERFLDGLTPSVEQRQTIAAFRFADDSRELAKDGTLVPSRAGSVIQHVLDGLDAADGASSARPGISAPVPEPPRVPTATPPTAPPE